MATVNILISDQSGGLLCLAILNREIRQVTGKELELVNIQ